MHSSFSGLVDQISRMTDTASAMGQAFDASKSGDYFYLPPEAFDISITRTWSVWTFMS